jgi:hypothetical protein
VTPEVSGIGMTLPLETRCGLWATHNGLWAAAATGCYTHARLTAQSATWLHPLRLVPQWPAAESDTSKNS